MKTNSTTRRQIKTRCKPGTTWRGGGTPRQSGISACPVHPEDRWLIAFLLAGGIRRQGTVWPRGISVSWPGGRRQKPLPKAVEGRGGGSPPTKTTLPVLWQGQKPTSAECMAPFQIKVMLHFSIKTAESKRSPFHFQKHYTKFDFVKSMQCKPTV